MLLGLASPFNMRTIDTVLGLQTKVKPKEPHFNILPQKLNAVDIGLSEVCERIYVLRKVIVYRSLCLLRYKKPKSKRRLIIWVTLKDKFCMIKDIGFQKQVTE